MSPETLRGLEAVVTITLVFYAWALLVCTTVRRPPRR